MVSPGLFLPKLKGTWFSGHCLDQLDNNMKKIIAYGQRHGIRGQPDLHIIEGTWGCGYALANVDSNLENLIEWVKLGTKKQVHIPYGNHEGKWFERDTLHAIDKDLQAIVDELNQHAGA